MVTKLSAENTATVPVRAPRARKTEPVMTPEQRMVVAISEELINQAKRTTDLETQVTQLTGVVSDMQATITALVRHISGRQQVVPAPAAPVPAPAPAAPAPARAAVAAKPRVPAFMRNQRLVATFESMTKRGLTFTRALDEKLAQPNAEYLRDAAHEYLENYGGSSSYVLQIARLKPEARTVPQLRGVLGNMLNQYQAVVTS